VTKIFIGLLLLALRSGDEEYTERVTCHRDGPSFVTLGEMVEELRPLLFSIAYRMLGSVAEAEDVVQEAFLRYHRTLDGGTTIDAPKPWLTTVTTRLAIDQLRSARARREEYIGEWLPEPLLTDESADVEQAAETADSLSLAFLVLLESLSPLERAVFLLRDVFGYGFADIAENVDRSEASCRQLLVRARRHVAERKPRFEASRAERDELADRFFTAAADGNTDSLVELLAADVVLHGDGGGKAPAIAQPIHGPDRVGQTLMGWARQAREVGATMRRVEVNGQPGVIFLDPEGRIGGVMTLDIAGGLVQTVRSIVNPEKLRHLGATADVRALLRGRRWSAADPPR
jgi:RNA polymerase sigma-70 factor (ECF subfamily)